MSSELNSTKTEATGNKEQVFNIEQRLQKKCNLSSKCLTSIIIRQDLQRSYKSQTIFRVRKS